MTPSRPRSLTSHWGGHLSLHLLMQRIFEAAADKLTSPKGVLDMGQAVGAGLLDRHLLDVQSSGAEDFYLWLVCHAQRSWLAHSGSTAEHVGCRAVGAAVQHRCPVV